MSDRDRLSTSLQESILTLLCFSDKYGEIAAHMLTPDYFEEPYYDVADRVLEFRQRFKKAPGEAHIDDIFDRKLFDTKDRRAATFRELLTGMVEQQSKGFNEEYILSRVAEFVERQTLTQAIIEAGDLLQQETAASADVKSIMLKALKPQVEELDLGVNLSDKRNIGRIMSLTGAALGTGIKALDRRGIGLTPKEMLLFIAPKGKGKSWWTVHLGRTGLMQGAKIVHITLEMDAYQVVSRYYQSFFAIGKRNEAFPVADLRLDELDRLVAMKRRMIKPDMAFGDRDFRAILDKQLDKWGYRFENVQIKQFPTGQLTLNKLRAYLDSLELVKKFIPTVLLIDYPDLMWIDPRQEHRIAIGNCYKDLRGLLVERNLAGGFPTQTGREGAKVTTVDSTNVAEDFSKNWTADQVLTYSQTKAEKELNLGRLLVAHNRNDEDKFQVLLAQRYHTGQFAYASARMIPDYFKKVKEIVGDVKDDPEATPEAVE